MIVLLMGVSGAGKSTVGQQLAERLRVEFLDPAVLETRLRQRRGHFFDPQLLESQLEALEEPQRALAVNAERSIDEVVSEVEQKLAKGRAF